MQSLLNVVITLGFNSSNYRVNENEGISIAVDLMGTISDDAVAQVWLATTSGSATADGML